MKIRIFRRRRPRLFDSPLAKVLEPIYQKGHHDIEVIRGTYTSTVYRDVDTLDPVAAAALAKEIVNGPLRSS